MPVQHIINVSGGKDSAACYVMGVRMGDRIKGWRAVFADTGNEHEATLEYVATLHERTGGPKVETVRADFTKEFARKRAFIAARWAEHGVPAAKIDRALEVLVPTGNPFFDLCMWKGRFPSRKAQFCTEELKKLPVQSQVLFPAARRGPVLQWIGVRRDESHNRRDTGLFRREDGRRTYSWYPIRHWSAPDVFAYLQEHGVEPNPLYRQGMGRVGCMPCINCKKDELAQIARRFPGHIERIAEWEHLVADASKRGAATFFAPVDPLDAERDGYADVREVVEWSRTTRGGRQYGLESWAGRQEAAPGCQSVYGLCE